MADDHMREFHTTLSVWNDKAGRYDFYQVVVSVNMQSVASMLGPKAVKSKVGKSRVLHGAVVVARKEFKPSL